MKTTTESITLYPGLDDAKLSTESLSTLIDTWSELQISAVEAVQAPTPNLFSFAETCFFFAVILKNEQLDSGNEGNFDNQLEAREEKEFERALKRSMHDAAQARGGGSSSTVAADARWGEFTSQEAQRSKPLQKIEQNLDVYKREEVPHDLMSSAYDMDDDISNYGYQSPALEPRGNSSITYSPHRPNLYHDEERIGAYGAREELPLSSLSRQFEPPTSTFLANHNNRNLGQSTSYIHFDDTARRKKAIGIVYLTCSPLENVPAGEASIGIILTPEARGNGLARQATELVLSWVFEDIGFHRVQAGILDSPNKDRAISMFTQLGFVHEGIRRRSVYCPNEGLRGTWKDVTYLALLETEWVMRSYLTPAPKNLWDEMFARHAREREDLLRWDERQQKMKRTSSMETLRVLNPSPEISYTTDEESDDPAVGLESGIQTPSFVHKGKRRKLDADASDSLSHASSPPPSDSEQSNTSWDTEGWESDEASGQNPAGSLSDPSSSSRVRLSPTSPGSPLSSNWDMMETSSVSSSSFESLVDSDED